MIVKNDSIKFERHDMNFVAKFGIIEASEMVMDFKSVNELPFIYDTYQLAHFLDIGRMDLFDIVNNCDNMYKKIEIPKKSFGTRVINAPELCLKHIQRIIHTKILDNISISKYASAYHKKAKLVENASPHVGKRFLLKLDLIDFFGSIQFKEIYSCVFNTKYFPKQIGVMLTKLCCVNDVLPQGTPTSPAISNIVMKNFDDNFGAWCEARGFSYTRYCDDITISGNKPLYPAYCKAKRWLENMGFEINPHKTRFITNASRQTVTGITVNEKLSVSADYKRKLRQEIYYALKFGIGDAVLHKNITKYIDRGKADVSGYYSYLVGKVSFVLSIEPCNAYFKKAFEELIALNIS